MPKDFKGRLVELVRESDLDYRPLAAAIGISQASLSKYTRGDAEPGLGALVKLATYFKVSTDYLAGLTDVKSPSPDLQAAVEYTGLSEEAVGVLADNKRHSTENEGSIGVYVISTISRILTHPNFRGIPHNICNAQYHNWLNSHSELLKKLMTFDECGQLSSVDDGGIDFFGYVLSNPVEVALLDEYKATKAMSQILSELCSEEREDPRIQERIEERLKIGENTRWAIYTNDAYEHFSKVFEDSGAYKEMAEAAARVAALVPDRVTSLEEDLNHVEA